MPCALRSKAYLLLRRRRMRLVLAAKAAQLLRAPIEPPAQHIEAHVNVLRNTLAQQEEVPCQNNLSKVVFSLLGFLLLPASSHHVDRITTQEQLLASS